MFAIQLRICNDVIFSTKAAAIFIDVKALTNLKTKLNRYTDDRFAERPLRRGSWSGDRGKMEGNSEETQCEAEGGCGPRERW